MGFWSVVAITLVMILDIGQWQGHLYCLAEKSGYLSILGDPGMRNSDSRFGLEAWNSCNEVGVEAPGMGSPRIADCADLNCSPHTDNSSSTCKINQRVSDSDNRLKSGNKIPNDEFNSYTDPDKYAAQKELYLGSLCEASDSNGSWSYWTIMLKNGNLDKNATFCPENGKKVNKTVTSINFPCFGPGCMNQPLVYRNGSKPVYDHNKNASLVGGFYGTYDLDVDLSAAERNSNNRSFFTVTWSKNSSTNSWIVYHKLTISAKYPWLMLYLRSDASKGLNGGYHYNGTGIMKTLPETPNFKVRQTLDIKQGGGPSSQFYLLDIGSCWKNDGKPCDGDVLTDVTRYSEMIINPSIGSSCGPTNLAACPPYHNSTKGEIIPRNDTARFPYSAYHYYCAPGNAKYLEKPSGTCDPFSNPQAQELVQLLPHSEWAVHGYPAEKGDGWVSGPKTWELDTGALSSRLYFYQDPGTPPAKRVWLSINVGTEMYMSPPGATAEWTVSDFDVLIPKSIEN